MAISANTQRPVRIPSSGITTRLLPLAGYTNYGAGSVAHTVYKGSVVISDVSDTDGYFSKMGAASGAVGDIFGGIAIERQDVGSGDAADGSKWVTVAVDGVWAFPKGAIAQTDIGAPIYVSDDGTAVTAVGAGANQWIGYLVEVDATYAWIDISRATGMVNVAVA